MATKDFGIWQNIGDILGYVTLLAGIIPFSVIRYIARGYEDAGKTGIIANILLALPLTAIFILLSPFFASLIGANVLYFQVASLQILLFYLLQVTQGIIHAKLPHVLGYGTIIFEITKIALGVFLVVYLGTGLLGAITAVVISQTILNLFYLTAILSYLKQKVNWGYLHVWWKISFINLYSILGERLGSLGLILLILKWGTLARAYVGAAMTIAIMVNYSNALAIALYPKLLAKSDSTSVEMALKMTMLFAIPMTGGIIILSDSLLTVLKPDYATASIVLCIYAIINLINCLSSILNTVTIATEKIDFNENITLRGLIKSKLFLLPSLTYLNLILYLIPLFVLLTNFTSEPLQAALYTSLVDIIAAMPIFLLRYKIAKKSLPFNLPWKNLARYSISTALMMIILSQITLNATLSRVLILILVGITIYFSVILTIDSETRDLLRTTVNFLQKKVRQLDI